MTSCAYNHSMHVKLWRWLAKHPDESKRDWPNWVSEGGDVMNVNNLCFACEYNKMVYAYECCGCPLIWPGEDGVISTQCMKSIYGEYNAIEPKGKRALSLRAALAKKISKIKVKEGITCI